MGLIQYIGFYTHQCGNIPDLVITKVGSKFVTIKCTLRPFISDHKALTVKTGLQKEKLEVLELCMWKIAKVTLDELNENFCMDNINLDAELSSICNQFISEMQKYWTLLLLRKR